MRFLWSDHPKEITAQPSCRLRDCPVGFAKFGDLGCFELGGFDHCINDGMIASMTPFGQGQCLCPDSGSWNAFYGEGKRHFPHEIL